MKELNVIIGDIKDSSNRTPAHYVLERCKELLSQYFEHVVVSQHAQIDLSSKSESADLKLAYYMDKLVLSSEGKILPAQKDLKVLSCVNQVVEVNCTFIVTKDMLNLPVIK